MAAHPRRVLPRAILLLPGDLRDASDPVRRAAERRPHRRDPGAGPGAPRGLARGERQAVDAGEHSHLQRAAPVARADSNCFDLLWARAHGPPSPRRSASSARAAPMIPSAACWPRRDPVSGVSKGRSAAAPPRRRRARPSDPSMSACVRHMTHPVSMWPPPIIYVCTAHFLFARGFGAFFATAPFTFTFGLILRGDLPLCGDLPPPLVRRLAAAGVLRGERPRPPRLSIVFTGPPPPASARGRAAARRPPACAPAAAARRGAARRAPTRIARRSRRPAPGAPSARRAR